MTTDKLRSVFEFYAEWCALHGVSPVRCDWDPTQLAHLGYMCRTALFEHIPLRQTDKAMRLLGFIQGVLVCRGFFTLADIRRHSMPDGEEAVV